MSSSCLAHFNHTQELPVVSSLGLCLLLFTALTPMEALCIARNAGMDICKLWLLGELFSSLDTLQLVLGPPL